MKTPKEIANAEMVEIGLSPNQHGDFTGAQLHALIVRAIEADRAQIPSGNFRPRFEPGERVENVSGGYGGMPTSLRPGTVVAIDDEPVIHHYLRVRFDDGEERQINPDVMRRIR